MNIPKRQGVYTLNLGQKTIKIDIHPDSVRLSKMDLLGSGQTIGGYKNETKYDVKVFDSNNNIINQKSTFDENEYIGFISRLICDENGTPSNPKEIMDKIYMKIQKDLDLWVKKEVFNGIVKGKMKMTFYIDDWDRNMGCCYEPQKLVDYFDSIGISCKVSPKKKQYRAGSVWVTTLYLPFDYNITENKTRNNMKKILRLTESDLHRIVKESVKRVIKEEHYNDAAVLPYITKAFDELINKIGNAAVAINGESWDAEISNDPFTKALDLIYKAKRVLVNA